MTYLPDMLIKNGAAGKDIVIVNAYIGGQTLKGHAVGAQYELPTYERQSFGTGGAMTSAYGVKLIDIITSNYWDYISIQQGADQAGNSTEYRDEDIEYLLGYIKDHCPNPGVKVIFHMTWAYAANTTQTVFNTVYGGDQMAMYNMIVETVQDKILPNKGFEFIIPSGTAVQNARTVYGDTLNSDGYHLNDRGRFIAGAMWLRQIYGFNVDVFDSPYQALNGYTITLDDMAVIAQCAEDAFDHPFDVTDQL
ncbi:MAG: DUF4886 domain-containing protein, partial [Treponema sp.]|nr:DUF4886 domain-containing protein [Treponema sp.]